MVIFHPYWDAVSFPCSNTRMRWVARQGMGIRQGAIFDGAYDPDMGDRRRVEAPENLRLYDSMHVHRDEMFSFTFSTKRMPDVNGTPACSITVCLRALADFPPDKDLRLFVDLIEDRIDVGPTASTISIANNVLMGVLPDTLGCSLGAQKIGTVTVKTFYCSAAGLVRNPDNVRLITFIQDAGVLPLPWETFSGTWPVTLENGPYPVLGTARFDRTPFRDFATTTMQIQKTTPKRTTTGQILHLDGNTGDIFDICIYAADGRKLNHLKRSPGLFYLRDIRTSGIRIIDVHKNGLQYFRMHQAVGLNSN